MSTSGINNNTPSLSQQADVAARLREQTPGLSSPAAQGAGAALRSQIDKTSDVRQLAEMVQALLLELQHDGALLKETTAELASLKSQLRDAQASLDRIPPRPSSNENDAITQWDAAHAGESNRLHGLIDALTDKIKTTVNTIDDIKARMEETDKKIESTQHKIQEKALQSADGSMNTQKDAANADAQKDEARQIIRRATDEKVGLAQQMIASGNKVDDVVGWVGAKTVLAALTLNAAGRGNSGDSVARKDTSTPSNPGLTQGVVNQFGVGPLNDG